MYFGLTRLLRFRRLLHYNGIRIPPMFTCAQTHIRIQFIYTLENIHYYMTVMNKGQF